MTPERWQKIQEIFAEALEREPTERDSYLIGVCTDSSLRAEVELMIAAHERGDSSFLEPADAGSNQSLKSGARIGSYEIVSAIGAGGMGEVYRGRDSKLSRDVAIKVLPTAFAHDPERIARFQREARFLASLNHPNIASIYGFEDYGDIGALVMELVEGPTLADRIKTGRIPVEEVLLIAREIAEALEYAHERGVVHRDLKPANIKITNDNLVKVLDFGLAKAVQGEAQTGAGASHTPTEMPTRTGLVLGTASYMSPEQAKGRLVDRRTDIWAFGCVLYEMLTGKRAFPAESITETLAAVLKNEPDWSLLPEATPKHTRLLLHRCLQKDAKQRLRDIGDARISLDETLSGHVAAGLADITGVRQPQPVSLGRRHAGSWIVLSGLALVAGIAVGWWASARRNVPSPIWSAQMLGGPSIAIGPHISPDGHTLAFAAITDGLTQVAIMDTESGAWTVLTKNRSRGYVTGVNWSRDGSDIYFDRLFSVPQGIYSVPRVGGDERLILEDAIGPEVLPDSSLLVVRLNKDRIFQLNHFWPETGRLQALSAFFPQVLDFTPVRAFRDGKEAVFFGKVLGEDMADPSPHLYVINLTSGESRRLAPELDLRLPSSLPSFPMAVAADDRSVFVDQKVGDLHRIISIPRDSTGTVRTLLTLTLPPLLMDVDREGNLYLDQLNRPIEVLRFSAAGGTPESMAGSENTAYDLGAQTLHLPDGRVVFESLVAGRSTLLAGKAGVEPTPFIQTKEETYLPACRLGVDEFAFRLGSFSNAVVAVASMADGRVVRRLDEIPAKEVTDLAASSDGKTLYYVASKTVWAISATGGKPRRISSGNAVATDPNGQNLIIQLYAKEGIRLMRVPASGGVEHPIRFQSPLRQTFAFISPNAIGKDGRVLLSVTSADSWFYGAALLNPKSGKVDRIELKFSGDVLAPEWLDDGRILAVGRPTKVTIWRFRPDEPKTK